MLVDGLQLTQGAVGIANGVSSLDGTGKIESGQLPSLVLTDTYVVATEVAMLALSAAEQGDICVRTDLNKTFILKTNGYATLANWEELRSPQQTTVIPYDIAFSVFDKPTAGEVVLRFVSPRAFSIPANCAGSLAKSAVAATGSSVFVIKKNGTQIATVTFAAAGTNGTFSTQAEVSFAAGDTLQVTAPASVDATLADVDFVLASTLS